MQIVVIIVFAVLMGLGPAGSLRLLASPAPGLVLGLLAAAHVLATAALSAWGSARASAALYDNRRGYLAATRIARRFAAMAQAWMAGSLAVFVLLGGTDWLRGVALFRAPLAVEALLVGLLLAALVTHWRLSYPFEHACRQRVEQDLMLAGMPVRRGWTAGEHLEFNLRHQFLFVAVPLGLIMLLHELVARAGERLAWSEHLQATLHLAAVALVFFISPVLLVGVWRTREMPDGELRRRLEGLCRRIGLAYRRILVWETGGVLANAAVMGLNRRVRYILVSDALLEQLSDEEIVAVFGHEAGHVRHRHIPLFALFILSASLCSGSAAAMVGMALQRAGVEANAAMLIEEGVMVAALALLFWQGFGRLSRLLERQADVFGSVCAGVDGEQRGRSLDEPDLPSDSRRFAYGSRVFIAALEAIARINGMPREGRNWRHGSIARRVEFLWLWRSRGLDGASFDRGLRNVYGALWLLFAAGLAGLALTWQRWWT